ncbi:hypothetical protein BH10PSE4_BH10PSE4_17670 [soil metagenome]
MMDEAIKTHKETSFGWVLAVQKLFAAVRRDKASRRAVEAGAKGAQVPAPPKPLRYLAPR